jgi:hypothetical protein
MTAWNGPQHRPLGAGAFFSGAIGQELLAFALVEDAGHAVNVPARLRVLQGAPAISRVDLDAFETGERQEKGIAGFVE